MTMFIQLFRWFLSPMEVLATFHIRFFSCFVCVSVVKRFPKHLNQYFVEPHICLIFSCTARQVQQIRHLLARKLFTIFMSLIHTVSVVIRQSARYYLCSVIWNARKEMKENSFILFVHWCFGMTMLAISQLILFTLSESKLKLFFLFLFKFYTFS